MLRSKTAATVLLLALAAMAGPAAAQEADLLLHDARAWTGDSARPWAEAIAVAGDRFVAVGDSARVFAHRGAATRVLDLDGRFVAPGFIDSHTHFERAGALLLGVNLLDVSDADALAERVREARDRLPEGAWIVGGDWGAYEAWERGSAGGGEAADPAVFSPHRGMIDSLTPATPALLSRWDRSAWLANGAALEAAGLSCGDEGVECEGGRPTGRLSPAAAARAREAVPPKPLERRLAESRAALRRLAERGVTTIHDITGEEQLEVFQRLRDAGELTVRVYARPTLDEVERLAALGIRHGFGDEWIRIGGLKGFVDGIMGNSSARFYEPYRTTGERGRWRDMMEPPGNMERLLFLADSTGHSPQVHAIGDEAIDTLLTLYANVMRENPPRERRFRVIHAQVLRGPGVADRMAELGVIAEMQPYHAIDDMRWMEERIGERARWAYAFRTLHEAGVLLSFGSDWPGTNASWYPASPVLGIYAAVTRRTVDGEPEGGWVPEERIGVEAALRAYTVNNAFAAREEAIKGRIAPGLVADLVVLDRSPFEVAPGELKDLVVERTIVGGHTVFARGAK
ncbi:MAG: amidohydrolase [Gemmatimonadota bacterium]|nr:amidohydrolase [Gemmatimonadota bacterium]